jgi:hypothetical protein
MELPVLQDLKVFKVFRERGVIQALRVLLVPSAKMLL